MGTTDTDQAHTLGTLEFQTHGELSVRADATCACGQHFIKIAGDTDEARQLLLVRHTEHRAAEGEKAREGQRGELEKELHTVFEGFYDTQGQLCDIMDRPLVHGQLNTEADPEYYMLSPEWHLIHAAIMATHAAQTLVGEAEKKLRERPA